MNGTGTRKTVPGITCEATFQKGPFNFSVSIIDNKKEGAQIVAAGDIAKKHGIKIGQIIYSIKTNASSRFSVAQTVYGTGTSYDSIVKILSRASYPVCIKLINKSETMKINNYLITFNKGPFSFKVSGDNKGHNAFITQIIDNENNENVNENLKLGDIVYSIKSFKSETKRVYGMYTSKILNIMNSVRFPVTIECLHTQDVVVCHKDKQIKKKH
eukprot:UN30450